MRIPFGRPSADAAEQAEADESTAELAASYWRAYDERMASTSFLAMARQFPRIVAQAMRLGSDASRRDLVTTIGLNVVSGVFTGYALLATTGVLQALFAAGPTPHRVRAAIPSLALVAAAVVACAGLQAVAGWAQARLQPQVDRVVEIRLFDLTTQVELSAFDDAGFHDAMLRARDRGLYSAPQVVADVINCITGAGDRLRGGGDHRAEPGLARAAGGRGAARRLGRSPLGQDRLYDELRWPTAAAGNGCWRT